VTVLSLQYGVNKDSARIEETLLDWQADHLLTITYDDHHRPVSFTPANQRALTAVHVTYDVTGHVTQWRRGDVVMTMSYDARTGQLTEWTRSVDQGQRVVYRYVYDKSRVVSCGH